MATRFNAGEVFEIAQQIERNGARFYGRAAEAADSPQLRATLADLASMERKHLKIFEEMSERLSAEESPGTAYDPNDEVRSYLRAVAGGQVFDLREDPNEWLTADRSATEVLRKAIELEKETIIFYLGIEEAVPEDLGKEWVDDIIREEMSHVRLLADRLEAQQEQ